MRKTIAEIRAEGPPPHYQWPQEMVTLSQLAQQFAKAHSNVLKPEQIQKVLPYYLDLLSFSRRLGYTANQVWNACVDARIANGEKPLFGGSVMRAKNYLPPLEQQRAKPKAQMNYMKVGYDD